jgi:hypothetical protein
MFSSSAGNPGMGTINLEPTDGDDDNKMMSQEKKRQLKLQKNRDSVKKYRLKKKSEY